MASASARRAASVLAATTTTALATGPPTVRSAAASLLGNVPPSAAATPLALTGAVTTRPLAAAAVTTSPLALTRATIPLALTRAAIPLALTRAATTIFGRRGVSCPPTLSRRAAATAGSIIARRGLSTEVAWTPELKAVLENMEKASVSRHQDLLKELEAFELKVTQNYSAAKISSAAPALTAGKVSWRVSSAVLAFGATALIAVLLTVKDGWRADFQAEVQSMLQSMADRLKEELRSELRQMVRDEMKAIEAEKVNRKK